MGMYVGRKTSQGFGQYHMSTTVQKTDWLCVSLNWHGCNGSLSAELNEFDPHAICQRAKAAEPHYF
jgi:hypothetical protein